MNEISINFALPEANVTDLSVNILKVIGVGGGGSNAVANMYRQNVQNVTYAVANTDSQALSNSEIPNKIALGTSGLGVGGNPDRGRECAEFSSDDIRNMLSDGTRMVFITAGMGGGTGTGAAPVIARIAREMDILTVGIVTLPFKFEKRPRIENALRGVEELKKNVDALLVINNERLLEIYSDGITTIDDAFRKADDVLTVATRSIAEIITVEGKVNRDFCDVQTVMKDGGGTIVSEGRANGENRILKAMASALRSPLFNNVEVEKAQRLLYVIYQSHQSQVKIDELSEVNFFMDKLSNDLEVLWGLYWDDTLGDDVKVTIIATGFDKERQEPQKLKNVSDEQIKKLIDVYYNNGSGSETLVEVLENGMDNQVKVHSGDSELDEDDIESGKNEISDMDVADTCGTDNCKSDGNFDYEPEEEKDDIVNSGSVNKSKNWIEILIRKIGEFVNENE